MRHILISLMLLCFLPQAKAQIETITQVIEPALLECRYKWVQKTDTLGTGIAVDTMVLRIGKNVSQHGSAHRQEREPKLSAIDLFRRFIS